MEKQELRNALSEVEDAARQRRNIASTMELREALDMIARLTQIVREEIVR